LEKAVLEAEAREPSEQLRILSNDRLPEREQISVHLEAHMQKYFVYEAKATEKNADKAKKTSDWMILVGRFHNLRCSEA
jgi:hypothetical protein